MTNATNNAAELPRLDVRDLLQQTSKTCDQDTYAFIEGSKSLTLMQLKALTAIYPEYKTRRLASIVVNPAGQPEHFRVTLQQHVETTGDVIERITKAGYTVDDIFFTIVGSSVFENMLSAHMVLMSPHLMELFVDVAKAIIIRNVLPSDNIFNPLAAFVPSKPILVRLERNTVPGFRVQCPSHNTPVAELLKTIPEQYRSAAVISDINLRNGTVSFKVPGGRPETVVEVYERISKLAVGKDMLYIAYWLANRISVLRNKPSDVNLRIDAAELVSIILADLMVNS